MAESVTAELHAYMKKHHLESKLNAVLNMAVRNRSPPLSLPSVSGVPAFFDSPFGGGDSLFLSLFYGDQDCLFVCVFFFFFLMPH